MAGDTVISIEGLAAVDEHLATLSKEAARKIARNALRKGGELMRKAVEVAAMELDRSPLRTQGTSALPLGALAADIRKGATTDESGNPSEWIGPGKYTAHVGRFVEYGHRQVRGGRSRVRKNGKVDGPGTQIGETQAWPFLRPAYEATAGEAIDVMVESLVEDVEKTASGAAVGDASGAPEVA